MKAFPRPFSLDGLTKHEPQEGMSLLQYYAGMALMGIAASRPTPERKPEDVAKWCRMVAEAMVAELE